jgi:hypothetical protein
MALNSHAYDHAFSTHHLIVFNTCTDTITCFACNRVLGTGTSVERGQVATIQELRRHAFGEERSTTLDSRRPQRHRNGS